LRVNLLFTQAPAHKSKQFFHYLILRVVTRHARGTRSTADWQLYKHSTAVCSHSQPHFSYVWACPVDALIPACQEPSF